MNASQCPIDPELCQEEHHRRKGFDEELRRLVKRYGLEWHDDEDQ